MVPQGRSPVVATSAHVPRYAPSSVVATSAHVCLASPLLLLQARNRLLKVDMMATIVATAMGAGSMISSIFGMNFNTPIFQQDDWVFVLVVGLIATLIVLMAFVLLLGVYGNKVAMMLGRCCGGDGSILGSIGGGGGSASSSFGGASGGASGGGGGSRYGSRGNGNGGGGGGGGNGGGGSGGSLGATLLGDAYDDPAATEQMLTHAAHAARAHSAHGHNHNQQHASSHSFNSSGAAAHPCGSHSQQSRRPSLNINTAASVQGSRHSQPSRDPAI